MSKSFLGLRPNARALDFVDRIREMRQYQYDLDYIDEAVRLVRTERAAERLRRHGFITRTTFIGESELLTMVCVYDPGHEYEPVWATATECRVLIDTVANMSLDDAFRRWLGKIELMDGKYPFRDTRPDAAKLRWVLCQRKHAGTVSQEEFYRAYDETFDPAWR